MNTNHLTDEQLLNFAYAYAAHHGSTADAMRAALATLPEPEPLPVVLPEVSDEDVAEAIDRYPYDVHQREIITAYRDRLAARIPTWKPVPVGATIKAGVRVREEWVADVDFKAGSDMHVLDPADYTLPDPDAEITHRPSPLNDLAQQINDNARAHGFWESERNFGEMIALAHSELSEALEEHREGRVTVWRLHKQGCPGSSDGLPDGRSDEERDRDAREAGLCSGRCKPEGVAVELADCIIRCLDTMHSLGVDIDAVVAEKMAYNAARPFKHNKAY